MTSSRFIFNKWCIKNALANTGEFSTGEFDKGGFSRENFPRESFPSTDYSSLINPRFTAEAHLSNEASYFWSDFSIKNWTQLVLTRFIPLVSLYTTW